MRVALANVSNWCVHTVQYLKSLQRPGIATRVPILSLIVVFTACAPGCIVAEIRDELLTSNESLRRSNQALAESNATLVQVRDELQGANQRLDSVEQRLATSHDGQAVLDSIAASLKAIDAHLATLRQTIENIDSRVPLVDFADDRATPPPPTAPQR